MPLLPAIALLAGMTGPTIASNTPPPLFPHGADWAVRATVVGTPPHASAAIITPPGLPARLYRAGDTLPNGIRLRAVYRNGIVVEQAGQVGSIPLGDPTHEHTQLPPGPTMRIDTPAATHQPDSHGLPDCHDVASQAELEAEMQALGYCPNP